MTRADDFPGLLNVARIAERAKLDFLFFSDSPLCPLDGPPTAVLRLEPVSVLSALAATTSHIGLVATISCTFTEPYNLARYVASIDRISGGRAGWNVVTNAEQRVADSFGRTLPPHDTRYAMADEYLQVVQALWDSWEPDAFITDPQTGEYFDRSKVHVLDHKGEYFSVKGPLGISRSPQGRPVIVQAGASDAGQAFAAKYAEIIFTIQHDLEDARAFYRTMKEMAGRFGRSPDDCSILPGLFTVIGRDEEEARRRYETLRGYIKPGSALGMMKQRLGHDMSGYPMDEPFPELPLSAIGPHGYIKVMEAKARREGLTLRDIHDIFALSRGYVMAVGTPKQVADLIEEWFESRACDGFMLLPSHFPHAVQDFAELVVPELQRRGLFRTEYEGKTLRSHFGLAEPKSRFAAG
jgi:FMN-dependent oxidoreductase (nitrilotriacetate monooxygenase family)